MTPAHFALTDNGVVQVIDRVEVDTVPLNVLLVLDELRSRYLLTYYPTGVACEGWHDVKVTLRGARGDVIARPGYFVAPTP